MLKGSAKKHHIGAAKPVVLITAEKRGSVDVGAAKGRIEGNRNGVAAWNIKTPYTGTESRNFLPRFREIAGQLLAVGLWKTAVRSVEFLRIQRARVVVKGELV